MRSSERGPSGGGTQSDPGSGGPGTAFLRERIESRIVYPEEAVRRGQQGEVILRIRIGAGGVPREIRVARSSGALLLDEAARRGVVRAAPLPSDPGWVEVPVRFRLR
jgi:protein TonB